MRFFSISLSQARGGAGAYVPARMEIHELLNISVNLYVDTNRALPDELYIGDANRRRPMSEINVHSKVWPQLGMRDSAAKKTRHQGPFYAKWVTKALRW